MLPRHEEVYRDHLPAEHCKLNLSFRRRHDWGIFSFVDWIVWCFVIWMRDSSLRYATFRMTIPCVIPKEATTEESLCSIPFNLSSLFYILVSILLYFPWNLLHGSVSSHIMETSFFSNPIVLVVGGILLLLLLYFWNKRNTNALRKRRRRNFRNEYFEKKKHKEDKE